MTAKFIIGDVFDGLASLEAGSVDLVVTSPPFLALRSYLPADHPDKGKEMGSEPTPAAFIDVMLEVTKELRRVLAPHGSICVELGDTYAGSGGAGGDYDPGGLRDGQMKWARTRGEGMAHPINHVSGTPGSGGGDGWPLSKSKALIPELYRIGLAYGINPLTGAESPAGKWRVRNTVTWCRPNPPVGALGDKWRPATSDLVVACTSGKRYWDDLATRKPHQTIMPNGKPVPRWNYPDGMMPSEAAGTTMHQRRSSEDEFKARVTPPHPSGAPLLDYWEIPLDGGEPTRYGPKEKGKGQGVGIPAGRRTGERSAKEHWSSDRELAYTSEHGAPMLDYWVIPPTGYSGSHYAVFPPALVEPLVKAMCPQRVCRQCGEPSRRIVKPSEEYALALDELNDGTRNGSNRTNPSRLVKGISGMITTNRPAEYATLGWTDCGHDDWRPGLVLDPFAGSGTTGLVATGHGHDAILIDIDERNAELALDRVGPFLLEVVDPTTTPA